MNVRPIKDRILVKPHTPEDQTKQGIVIPKMSKAPVTTGFVMAIGPGRTDERGRRTPVGVLPGDKIMFSAFAGWPTTDDPDGPRLMSAQDVECVLEVNA